MAGVDDAFRPRPLLRRTLAELLDLLHAHSPLKPLESKHLIHPGGETREPGLTSPEILSSGVAAAARSWGDRRRPPRPQDIYLPKLGLARMAFFPFTHFRVRLECARRGMGGSTGEPAETPSCTSAGMSYVRGRRASGGK
jgi:hypothetical protein